MKIGVVLPAGGGDGPTGGMPSWQDTLAMAKAAEDSGLDSGWIADHFFYRPGDGPDSGMQEVWTLLSALAAATSRIELGPIVLCASFRNPGLTAKMAVTLDDVSGGRLVLGVGCGWHEAEYDAFGFPFDHRVGRFAEWLEILARLLRGERVTLDGEFHKAADAVLVPAPSRQIPILIAAKKPRMFELTARWADQWNTAWYGQPDDRLTGQLAALAAAEAAAGREPGAVVRTVGLIVRDPDQPVEEPDERSLTGSVDDVARTLDAYRALGIGHVQVITEPMTVRSVERLAKAVRRLDR
jgi:alkanesulfonate monooxygenase SsuD/methylene tetrahydromethanopterin reductase-like flavin-dependent oxidoreductase (luciferase family)